MLFPFGTLKFNTRVYYIYIYVYIVSLSKLFNLKCPYFSQPILKKCQFKIIKISTKLFKNKFKCSLFFNGYLYFRLFEYQY